MPRGSVKSYKSVDSAMRAADRQVARRLRRGAYRRTSRGIVGRTSSRGLVRARAKETGFVDNTAGTFAFDTTGSIFLIATVAQGASVNQRVGKKITWKGMQFRGYIENGSTATRNQTCLYIVYDRRPTGTLPAVTDILVTATSDSLSNDANAGRFKILHKDIDFLIGDPDAAAVSGRCGKAVDTYLNLRSLPCVFKAAVTGAIGDIEEGALYCVCVGSTAAGTSAASADLNFRTRFWDV